MISLPEEPRWSQAAAAPKESGKIVGYPYLGDYVRVARDTTRIRTASSSVVGAMACSRQLQFFAEGLFKE